jgi:hypothetical protein
MNVIVAITVIVPVTVTAMRFFECAGESESVYDYPEFYVSGHYFL